MEDQMGDDAGMASGAPTPLTALEGIAGLTKRDIQTVMDGGLRTIESVAYTPKRILEGFKGFSEVKAAKMLAEGKRDFLP